MIQQMELTNLSGEQELDNYNQRLEDILEELIPKLFPEDI